MKFVKYTVYLPIKENETKTIIFYTLKEVCEFLKLNTSSVYNIIDENCNFKHKSLHHLRGIRITREELDEKIKEKLREKYVLCKKKIKNDDKAIVYQKNLLDIYNEKIKNGELKSIDENITEDN